MNILLQYIQWEVFLELILPNVPRKLLIPKPHCSSTRMAKSLNLKPGDGTQTVSQDSGSRLVTFFTALKDILSSMEIHGKLSAGVRDSHLRVQQQVRKKLQILLFWQLRAGPNLLQ